MRFRHHDFEFELNDVASGGPCCAARKSWCKIERPNNFCVKWRKSYYNCIFLKPSTTLPTRGRAAPTTPSTAVMSAISCGDITILFLILPTTEVKHFTCPVSFVLNVQRG